MDYQLINITKQAGMLLLVILFLATSWSTDVDARLAVDAKSTNLVPLTEDHTGQQNPTGSYDDSPRPPISLSMELPSNEQPVVRVKQRMQRFGHSEPEMDKGFIKWSSRKKRTKIMNVRGRGKPNKGKKIVERNPRKKCKINLRKLRRKLRKKGNTEHKIKRKIKKMLKRKIQKCRRRRKGKGKRRKNKGRKGKQRITFQGNNSTNARISYNNSTNTKINDFTTASYLDPRERLNASLDSLKLNTDSTGIEAETTTTTTTTTENFRSYSENENDKSQKRNQFEFHESDKLTLEEASTKLGNLSSATETGSQKTPGKFDIPTIAHSENVGDGGIVEPIGEMDDEEARRLTHSMPTPDDDQGFDVVYIARLWRHALKNNANDGRVVNLDGYVRAYEKLNGVFEFFGPFLSFAKSDLDHKLVLLNELRNSHLHGPKPQNYVDFGKMFQYEYDIGIALPGRSEVSGVRENAWIHRALKFIISIMRTTADTTESAPLSVKVKEFYTDILAPYHSWIVRMGVYAAIYSFPSREQLLSDMNLTNKAEDLTELTELTESAQAVYDAIQALYDKHAPSS